MRLSRLRLPRSDELVLFSFLVPALLFFSVFFLYPSLGSIYFSFTDWHGLERNIHFVGLQNFIRIFHEEVLGTAFKNTLLLVVIVTVVQNGIALTFAILLNGNIKSRNILRTVFFLPQTLSTLSIGFIWSYIYNPVDGILNVLFETLGLGFLKNDWLGNIHSALFSIMVIIIWQCAGFSMVVFLSGLKSIPPTYYEAATIDGASPFQKFRLVTLPLLMPAINVNILLSVIGGMKTFDVVFSTTGGGPGYETETIATTIFEKAFLGKYEYGYGTAIAIVLFVVILLLSQALSRFFRSREVEL